MNNAVGVIRGRLGKVLLAAGLVFVASICWTFGVAAPKEVTVPLLQIGPDYFTNATLTPQSPTHVTVLHSRGMTMAKIADLDPDVQRQLGFDPGPAKGPRGTAETSTNKTSIAQALRNFQAGAERAAAERESNGPPLVRALAKMGRQAEQDAEGINASDRYEQLTVTQKLIGFGTFGGLAVFYLFFCGACRQLCRRAGAPSDFLVWFPWFKRLSLYRATNTSWWWFFLIVIPVIGQLVWLIGWFLCCLRLCDAFQQSRWWAVLMLIPIGGWAVFIHFAQSSRADDSEPAVRSADRGYAW